MNRSIKKSLYIVIAASIGLYGSVVFLAGFGLSGDENTNGMIPLYITAALSLVALLAGLAMLLASMTKTAQNNKKAKIALTFVIAVYAIVGFGAFYYILGGQGLFEADSFKKNFQTTYLQVTYLPEGSEERFTSFSASGVNDSIYGLGNYAKTSYGFPLIDSNGDIYYREFYIEQGDQKNKAAGMLQFCGVRFECDIIDGENVKDIHCGKRDSDKACSVQHLGTYITVSGMGLDSKDDSIKILDSITQVE